MKRGIFWPSGSPLVGRGRGGVWTPPPPFGRGFGFRFAWPHLAEPMVHRMLVYTRLTLKPRQVAKSHILCSAPLHNPAPRRRPTAPALTLGGHAGPVGDDMAGRRRRDCGSQPRTAPPSQPRNARPGTHDGLRYGRLIRRNEARARSTQIHGYQASKPRLNPPAAASRDCPCPPETTDTATNPHQRQQHLP